MQYIRVLGPRTANTMETVTSRAHTAPIAEVGGGDAKLPPFGLSIPFFHTHFVALYNFISISRIVNAPRLACILALANSIRLHSARFSPPSAPPAPSAGILFSCHRINCAKCRLHKHMRNKNENEGKAAAGADSERMKKKKVLGAIKNLCA